MQSPFTLDDLYNLESALEEQALNSHESKRVEILELRDKVADLRECEIAYYSEHH